MPASKNQVHSDQDIQEDHFHVISQGSSLLVLRHSHAWRPPTDVMADEDRLVVIVEAAGMRQSEFKVSVTNQRLIIVGVRPHREQAHTTYHQLEIRYGEFRTEVYLPWPVDQEKIVAEYEDGFLRVELARATPSQTHVVDVRKIDTD